MRGAEFFVDSLGLVDTHISYARIVHRALRDVSQWLGFEYEADYNRWCESCTPDEFRERLAAAE